MSTAKSNEGSNWFFGALLALLPVGSFICQYWLSLRAGTLGILLKNLTVTLVDWIFIPFNFFVVRTIDWSRGQRLYLIFLVSTTLTAMTHAFWQFNGIDAGHMITKDGVVLPAGWVHLMFSTSEMVLLVAFVLCRKKNAPRSEPVTVLATVYFLAEGACGYILNRGFVITDVVVLVSGLFFVLVYPRVAQISEAR